MGTSRVVNDENGCNEIEDTVTVNLCNLPKYTLLLEPDRTYLQGF